jgi:hypothetical protein
MYPDHQLDCLFASRKMLMDVADDQGVAQRTPPVKITKLQVAGARGRFLLPGGQMVPITPPGFYAGGHFGPALGANSAASCQAECITRKGRSRCIRHPCKIRHMYTMCILHGEASAYHGVRSLTAGEKGQEPKCKSRRPLYLPGQSFVYALAVDILYYILNCGWTGTQATWTAGAQLQMELIAGDYPAKSNYYSSLGGFGRTTTVPNATSLEECLSSCMVMPECVQATWAPLPWPVKILRCSVCVPQINGVTRTYNIMLRMCSPCLTDTQTPLTQRSWSWASALPRLQTTPDAFRVGSRVHAVISTTGAPVV